MYLQPGVIHALVGGNGSGKSTLIKILAGVERADPGGVVRVGERRVAADAMTPVLARGLGLRFVHQDPGIFPSMTVAENIAIGSAFPTGAAGRIRWPALRRSTQALLDRFEIHATPTMCPEALSPATRTMVAIARALQHQEDAHSGVLVLDEPTASLPDREVVVLMEALRRYASRGQTIVFVSHRLDEVAALAADVTVLRDGENVGTLTGAEICEDALVCLIVGRPLDRMFPEMPPVRAGEPMLRVQDLCGGPIRGVDLVLARGEIVGVAGLLGSGRTTLLRMLFGERQPTAGVITLEGVTRSFRSPRDAIRAGIAYVPDERAISVFAEHTVSENLSAACVPSYWSRFRLRRRRERDDSRRLVEAFLVRASSVLQPMFTLSGGNQQKVVLARWLRSDPLVLLLDEPTQGVDVEARAEIYSLVRSAIERGASALVVASDFEELAHVSDRVLVLRDGRIVAEVCRPDLSPHVLTQLAFASEPELV
jgi:ribose transport system ATP-binding protein